MDSYDRLIGKTLYEMKFNYYDNALREYSKDNIWFQSYNQLKYGIEDTDISILNTFVHNFVNTIKNIEYLDIDDNNVLFIKEDIIINLKTERINND